MRYIQNRLTLKIWHKQFSSKPVYRNISTNKALTQRWINGLALIQLWVMMKADLPESDTLSVA